MRFSWFIISPISLFLFSISSPSLFLSPLPLKLKLLHIEKYTPIISSLSEAFLIIKPSNSNSGYGIKLKIFWWLKKKEEMPLKTCMNILCGTTSSAEWKTGWTLRSGELAILCDTCGSAYEQSVYCEEFHADDSGWRECLTCGKRLHCGCIASWSLIELLDGGGVKCIGCATSSGPNSSSNNSKRDGSGPCTLIDSNAGIIHFGNPKGSSGSNQPSMWNVDTNTALGILKRDEILLPLGEVGTTSLSNLAQSSMGLFQRHRLDVSTTNMQGKDKYESLAQPNLNITLGVPMGGLHSISGAIVGEREERKMSNALHQGFVPHHLLEKPPKLALSPASGTNVSAVPQVRVARPPVEGRGRHQLLPRYWPRITDQELQQISGDSNCTIVPLFEKVLSASDAGRIGRLVLPKACAEAYFPTISQPEGLPIKIQDVKGKEWVFQFRFWPNNNSRMYVLEGVTPCIQSMQLQAGDTVTFSRMDPEGKLVMGFRKASNSVAIQSTKGTVDPQMNVLSRHLDSIGGNINWNNNEKYGERTEEGMLPSSMLMLEKKKSLNIGSKSKRLLIDSQDILALRLSWEEVQGMLRPPQCEKPSIVIVEDYEFEEYEEPPVFGKRSIFTARSSGAIEQWTQCDSCSKWRRLAADVLLPPKWTCAENVWDQSRCFCSAPDELGPKELDYLQLLSKDSKKRRTAMANRPKHDGESSGLDALANAATSGDNNTSDPGSSSVAVTTKHPRHRSGCSCIVCIQPPSGKGKHKSTCTCTVCMTVKRRFKTLMMKKKKRQSEQEAETALKNHQHKQSHMKKEDDKAEAENIKSRLDHRAQGSPNVLGRPYENDLGVAPVQNNDGRVQHPTGVSTTDAGNSLDLNCHPGREEDSRMGPTEATMTNLLQLASLPLEAYMKQNGLTSLTSKQRAISATLQLGQVPGETEGRNVEGHHVDQAVDDQVKLSDESSVPDNEQQNDPL